MNLPRITIPLAAVVALGVTVSAQGDLERKLAKKLEGSWVKNAAWITDFGQAKKAARKSGKQIFAYFTRSYSP